MSTLIKDHNATAFGGGNNWYAYVDNNPLNATDPSGLCANPGYCRKLLAQIVSKTNGFFNRFKRYHDAGFKDFGGKDWSHGGESGVTQPGGHYKGLGERQNGIMNDILEYIKNCIKPGDPPPPGLEKGFEAAKKHIPYPANWPTQDELRMQEQANRNMERFWNTVLQGSIYGGAAYLGAPVLIRAAPAAIGAVWQWITGGGGGVLVPVGP